MLLTKWRLAEPPPLPSRKAPPKAPPPPARRPIKLASKKGSRGESKATSTKHHTAVILAVAVSSSGKIVATGGADNRLIIWSAEDLTPLRIFSQHRDAITSLAFRRGTNHLYSGSKDRTIKTWSLDELAYVETLFGHQDEVVDVAALAQERCVSVGARDRTARLWKVAEETQLVFRGGGSGSGITKTNDDRKIKGPANRKFAEGSIDRISMIDEETFITGSDNGSLSLWSIHKKKPIFTVPLAHGLDPPPTLEEYSAEKSPDPIQKPPEPQPRWITALTTVPYSDLILSGSWDGHVRVWKVSHDKKRLERSGIVGRQQVTTNQEDITGENNNDDEEEEGDRGGVGQVVRGVINDLAVFERGERGKDGLCVVVGLGTEHKFGRWKCVRGGKNGAVVFEVPSLIGKEEQGQGQEERVEEEEEEEEEDEKGEE